MIRLHQDRLALLRKYLKDSQVNSALFEEMLDHLACEAEERLWDGAAFEEVLLLIAEEANPQVLLELNADLKSLLEEEQSLTDMVFEGRNKQYGAYDLRKGYGHTIQRSLVMGVAFFLLLVLLPDLYARLSPGLEIEDIGYELELNRVDIRPTITFDKDNFREGDSGEPELLASIESAPLPKKPHELVVESGQTGINIPVGVMEAENLLLPHQQLGWVEPNDWQRKPEFPGGPEKLLGYIETRLNYPLSAVQNKIEGKVLVGFTISPQGQVQDVDVLEGIGFGCDQVAKDIVATMPIWKPGNKLGKPASFRYILPVAFELNK